MYSYACPQTPSMDVMWADVYRRQPSPLARGVVGLKWALFDMSSIWYEQSSGLYLMPALAQFLNRSLKHSLYFGDLRVPRWILLVLSGIHSWYYRQWLQHWKNSGRVLLCCIVTWGWGRLETRLPIARGSSPELSAFTMSLAPPGLPLPHLLDGHRKLVGCSAIPARSCPGPVRYPWGSIVELEVPPDETLGLITFHFHNTNVLQSITYTKSQYPSDRSNPRQKTQCFRHEYGYFFQPA